MSRIVPATLLTLLFLAPASFAATSKTISGPLSMAASVDKKILVVRIGATTVKKYTIAVGTK